MKTVDNKPFLLSTLAIKLVGKLPRYASVFCISMSVFANPVVDNIAAGSVSIQQTPETTTVNQTSQKAIINWQSFNIAAPETTHFQQPAGGVTLNRINPSQGVSQIYGRLTATGKIILVNPAGIFFGAGSFVNVGGLIASTANITDQDFLNNYYNFSKVPGYNGAIVNQGTIKAAENGLIALIGGAVSNEGYIEANVGHVVLAGGDAFTMTFAGNDLIGFEVDKGVNQRARDQNNNEMTDGVKNTGSIQADGGHILISARDAAGVLDHVINMQGYAQAKSVYTKHGSIIISGNPNAGKVRIAAKIKASGNSPGSSGGNVTITGFDILLNHDADIDVSGVLGGGNINIGGNYQGVGPLSHANSVVMASGAKINANALINGNGGNVVLWSDYYSNVKGSISARGGSDTGNGGLIETSSHRYLDVNGAVIDTRAINGKTGTWMLDPTNIYIADNQGNATTAGMTGTDNTADTGAGVNPTTFTASGAVQDSLLLTNSLTTALASTNVIVSTANASGTGLGNITVVNPVAWASGYSLTLSAANNIALNAAITTGTGASSLILSTPAAVTQTAAGTIGGSGSLVVQGGGTVTLSRANTYSGGTTIQHGTVIATAAANNALGTGAVTLGDVGGGNNNASLLIGTTGLNYSNPIVLAANTTGTLILGNSGTAISTTFSGGVTGTNNLTINSNATTGTVTFATGAINHAGSITNSGTGSGAVTISSIIGSNVTDVTQSNSNAASVMTLSGANTYTGNTVVNGAGILAITSDGNLGAVPGSPSAANIQIGGGGTWNSASGTVTYAGTIDGGNALTLNGPGGFILGGSIGSVTPLASLTKNSNAALTLSSPVVTTDGTQTYTGTGAVTLAGNPVLTSNSGNIVFTSAVNGDVAATRSLTANALSGTVTFSGSVGATRSLTGLTVNTNSGSFAGSFVTTGTQTYNYPITLIGNTVFSSSAGSVDFGSTINGPFSFTVTQPGAFQFTPNVNSLGNMSAITITNSVNITNPLITTTAGQSYGAMTLDNLNAVTFTGTSVSMRGAVNSSGIPTDVVINGSLIFRGGMGQGAGGILNSLTVNGSIGTGFLTNANVATIGNQVYGSSLSHTYSLGQGVIGVLTSTNGSITFNTSIGNPNYNGFNITAPNGFVRFNNTYFGGVGNLIVTSPDIIINVASPGYIGGPGIILFNGPVTLLQNLTTALYISIENNYLMFNTTVNGPGGLTITGNRNVYFNGVMGGTTALSHVSVDPDTYINAAPATSYTYYTAYTAGTAALSQAFIVPNGTNTATLTTSGSQTYNGTVRPSTNTNLIAGGAITLNNVSWSGASTLQLTAGSSVNINNIINAVNGTLKINAQDMTTTANGYIDIHNLDLGNLNQVLNVSMIGYNDGIIRANESVKGRFNLNGNGTITGNSAYDNYLYPILDDYKFLVRTGPRSGYFTDPFIYNNFIIPDITSTITSTTMTSTMTSTPLNYVNMIGAINMGAYRSNATAGNITFTSPVIAPQWLIFSNIGYTVIANLERPVMLQSGTMNTNEMQRIMLPISPFRSLTVNINDELDMRRGL